MKNTILNVLNISDSEMNLFNEHFVKQNIVVSNIGCKSSDYYKIKKLDLLEVTGNVIEIAKKSHIKLNIQEAVWILLILKIKSFGIELTRLIPIKKHFDEMLNFDELLNEKINQFQFDKSINPELIEIFEQLKSKDSQLFKELKEEIREIKFNGFGLLVFAVLLKGYEIDFYLYLDQEEELKIKEVLRGSEDQFYIENISSGPYIFISLNKLVEEIVLNEKIEKQLFESSIFDKNVMIILELLRKKEVSELSVKLKNNEIIDIITKRTKEIKDKDIGQLKKAIGFNQCKEISIKSRNSKHMLIQISEKIKLE